MPLNGRQFANLAATIPASAWGFIPTRRRAQYAPQIGVSGNGRNINYQIDAGDNNDDTGWRAAAALPLEAIQNSTW
jgi:hypothetical protein